MLDKIRDQMVELAGLIHAEKDQEKKAALLVKARNLIERKEIIMRKDAQKRVTELFGRIPSIYKKAPDALNRIREKRGDYAKFIPFLAELEKGERMAKEIAQLRDQFGVEPIIPNKNKTGKLRPISSKRENQRIKTSAKYARQKMDRINTMNANIDGEHIPASVKQGAKDGKARLVTRETEYNGDRRPSGPTQHRYAWNPEGKKLAGAKGAHNK